MELSSLHQWNCHYCINGTVIIASIELSLLHQIFIVSLHTPSVTPCFVSSRHALSRHAMLCHVTPFVAMLCHVTPYVAVLCPVTPCPIAMLSVATPRHATPRHAHVVSTKHVSSHHTGKHASCRN
jgi:hypothetical protein